MKKTYSKQERDFTEIGLSSNTAHRGSFFELKEDRVRLPDGKETVREYLVHPGAVVIIPLLDNGDLVMEWQYRYALKQHFYELPAGKLIPGEDPLECAKRELLEETGYVAHHWQCLGVAYPCLGYSSEKQFFYLARGLSQRERQLDDGEFLEVQTLDWATLLMWVTEGRITDGKTLNGLFWFDRLHRGAL